MKAFICFDCLRRTPNRLRDRGPCAMADQCKRRDCARVTEKIESAPRPRPSAKTAAAMRRVASLARKAGFRDYRGGAGPSPAHANRNTRALFAALQKMRVKGVRLLPLAKASPWEPLGVEDGEILAIVRGNKAVNYDRWGFFLSTRRPPTTAGLLREDLKIEGAYRYLTERTMRWTREAPRWSR